MEDSAHEVAVDPAWLDDVGVGVVAQAADGTVLRANAAAAHLAPAARPGAVVRAWPAGVRAVRHEAADGSLTILVPADQPAITPAARRDAEQLRTIIDTTPVGVCVTDEHGLFEQVNAAYERFYGYRADELLGRHFTMVVPPENRGALTDLHDRFIAEGAEVRGEWAVVRKDGSAATILADACRILGADGRPRKVTFVVDITERRRMEAELERANARLEHLATHDALTRLPNQRRAREVLTDAVAYAARYGGDLAVAVLDLDHFKRVNDTWGHGAGDDVLSAFGAALGAQLRTTDTAGRIGGEEFVVVLPATGEAEAAALLARLQARCRERVTMPDGGGLAFSAGLTTYRAGDGSDDLLRRADRALYRAKAAGRDRVELG